MPYKIQTSRTMIEKMATLEKEVKALSTKDSQKEKQEAEAPIINPMNRPMLTFGNGYAPQAPVPPMMTGAPIMPNGTPVPMAPAMTGFVGF